MYVRVLSVGVLDEGGMLFLKMWTGVIVFGVPIGGLGVVEAPGVPRGRRDRVSWSKVWVGLE